MNNLEVELPHGLRFRFVHKVISVTIEDDRMEAVTQWTYTGEEDGAADHFPGQPVCPGIWIQEHMNQSLIQIAQRIPDIAGKIYTLIGQDGFRVRKIVVPGSTFETRVAIIKLKPSVGKGMAESYINGELVANVKEIIFGIQSK